MVPLLQRASFRVFDIAPDELLIALPVILVRADMSASIEEFSFGQVPLRGSASTLGRPQPNLLLALVFGLLHRHVTHGGIQALRLDSLSRLVYRQKHARDRGMGLTWRPHVLLDIVVYTIV